MPKLYAVILRYDTEANQADSIVARKQVINDALDAANKVIATKMSSDSDKRRQVWGLFTAPEYVFANVLTHDNHKVGDVRHLSEGDKVEIEAWLKGLSVKYPHILLFPGSIAWKKPAERDLNNYIAYKKQAGSKLSDEKLKAKFDAKKLTRKEKARAAVRQNANDFLDGDLDVEVAGPMEKYKYRGYRENKLSTNPDEDWWFETDDPSGIMFAGKRWTLDVNEAALDTTIIHSALSNREKLAELGGGGVTHLARNTCLVYLNGRRVAKYNKAQDYHEVLDSKGDTVYIPGKSVPVFDVDGIKYGVEICLDHAYASASERLPSAAKPAISVVLSAKVRLKTDNLANKGAMVVHACSYDSWSLVGTGGVDKANAVREVDDPHYFIYSFDV
jgi:hypothetical protein